MDRPVRRRDCGALTARIDIRSVNAVPAGLAAENARLELEKHRAETERDILEKAALIFGGATHLSGHRLAMPRLAAHDVRVRYSRRLLTIACRRRMGIAVSGR